MFARAQSGTIIGVDAHPVIVESYRGKGLPGMALIGLAKGAAKEALVRVRSAFMASQIQLGSHKLVVNLLPAELEKDASALDLALAVSLLVSGGHLPVAALEHRRFFGELSLGGGLMEVRGAVLVADLARRTGDQELIVPYDNMAEAAVLPGVRVLGARSLSEVFAYLCGEGVLEQGTPRATPRRINYGCLSEVRGQAHAKRAMEIAAAGEHNVLLLGPPGSGKTMLARRLAGLLPELTAEERIEITRIHSVARPIAAQGDGLVWTRPFRSPHHTASEVALCGGGSKPRPGEITLAHRGVLFLDELPEFARRALESLREPLEEGAIHVARAAMSLSFPAQVLLVAAMNPCPCGYYQGDLLTRPDTTAPQGRVCMCPFDQVLRYRGRISGPLLDRIDLHVLVDAVPYRDYASAGSGEQTVDVRARVEEARALQVERWGAGRTNARMNDAEVRTTVQQDGATLPCLENAIERFGLSTRAVSRIVKVARTIADLEGAREVSAQHVGEAVGFRVLDRQPAVPATEVR